MWGRRGDGLWETDLTSSRRSTWPCCQAPLFHGPWAPTAPPRLIADTQKLRTPLRFATQLDQRPVTGAADCRALDRYLKGAFLLPWRYQPASWHSLLLLTCPSIPNFPQ